MRRAVVGILLLVGSTLLVLGATIPKDIMAVLEKIDKNNANYKTAKASLQLIIKMGPMSQTLKGELLMDNTKGKFKASIGEGAMLSTIVYDGEYIWTYSSTDNEYSKNLVPSQAVQEGIFFFMPISIALSPICKKTFTSQNFLSTLGKSSLGKTILNKKSAHLITFTDKEDGSVIKIVVDAKEYKVLQVSFIPPGGQGEMIYKVISLQANPSFPEGTFAFTPPPGAKEYVPPKEENLEGQLAPDFTLQSLDGKTYKLSDLKGKVVLIDFWATWCPPCQEELPIIEKLHKEFSGKGLVVLGINDEDKVTLQQFVNQQKLTFTNLLDSEGAVARAYKVTSIPRVILVDKNGKIVKDITGYNPQNEKILKELITKLLGD
ncbi:redoxin domain-containing protein [bacterium]|nr:redoxin domain-containing protein [bacterium]